MSQREFPVAELHHAFEDIPHEVAHHVPEPPRLHEVYVVPGHEKALNPETPVVVGDRGTGKSFWSAALNGEETRLLIGRELRRLRMDSVRVSWGFSAATDNRWHPSRRVLRSLRSQGFGAEDIWRTVLLHHLADAGDMGDWPAGADWAERVRRVAEAPEMEERLLTEADARLQRLGDRHLFVFDALDRLGDDWRAIRDLLQGLLRVCLDLRGYRAIRTKLFLRPDMWEDQAIWGFPDASKLHHGRVLLEWRRIDLYGLLWHWLGNHPGAGAPFRDWCRDSHDHVFEPIPIGGETVYAVPAALRTDEGEQARLLEVIASRYMGRNRRRGRTYTWLPTHLADAKGQVSPRSFLLALKHAHTATQERLADETLLLHYEGIKQGVQEASRIRLQELQEDYPWIRQVLAPLQGMTVPCTAEELRQRWRAEGVVDAISSPPPDDAEAEADDRAYLPPHALEYVPPSRTPEDALIEAVIEIGVMSRIADGRLNMPDLFRVAAGIGRRGGVRAIR